jgi:transposase
LGRPVRFILTAGQAAEIKSAEALLENIAAGGVIADKGYDSNALRKHVAQRKMIAVIPSNRTRRVLIPHDPIAYKTRNRIERCFNKLKHFRRIATRFDRRALHFLSFLHLAASLLWLR